MDEPVLVAPYRSPVSHLDVGMYVMQLWPMRCSGRSAQGLWGKNCSFPRETLVKKYIVRSRCEARNSYRHLAAMKSASIRIKPIHWPGGKTERKRVLDIVFEFLNY